MTPQEWLLDSYNPLSPNSSTDKLKEAHRIINRLSSALTDIINFTDSEMQDGDMAREVAKQALKDTNNGTL